MLIFRSARSGAIAAGTAVFRWVATRHRYYGGYAPAVKFAII